LKDKIQNKQSRRKRTVYKLRHAGFSPASSQIMFRWKRTLSYWIPAFAGMTSAQQAAGNW